MALAPKTTTSSKTVTDTIVGEQALATDCLAFCFRARALARSCELFWRAQQWHACFATGEHTHTIVGYSLVKGIGDGEPIASERFVIGGHEWVSEVVCKRSPLCVLKGARAGTDSVLH